MPLFGNIAVSCHLLYDHLTSLFFAWIKKTNKTPRISLCTFAQNRDVHFEILEKPFAPWYDKLYICG